MTPDTLTVAPALSDVGLIDRAADILRAGTFTVLTGAGVSTDSGIPDYRGEGAPKNHPMSFREVVSSAERRPR